MLYNLLANSFGMCTCMFNRITYTRFFVPIFNKTSFAFCRKLIYKRFAFLNREVLLKPLGFNFITPILTDNFEKLVRSNFRYGRMCRD